MIIFLLFISMISASEYRDFYLRECADSRYEKVCLINNPRELHPMYNSLINLNDETEFNFVVLIRRLYNEIMLVKIHLEQENNFDEVAWYQGGTKLFGCSGKATRVDLIGEPELLKKHEVELFQKQSQFDERKVVCAFTLTNPRMLKEYFVQNFELDARTSIRFFTNGNEQMRFIFPEPYTKYQIFETLTFRDFFLKECKEYDRVCLINDSKEDIPKFNNLINLNHVAEFNFVVFIRFLNIDIMLMKIHYEQGDNFDEFAWHQGEIKLFGCSRNANGVDLIGDAELLKKHEVELFEKQSQFDERKVVCVFTLTNLRMLKKYFVQEGELDASSSIRFFTNGSEQMRFVFPEFIYSSPWRFITTSSIGFTSKERAPRSFCVPYFQDLKALKNYHVLPIIGRDRTTLDCTNYGPLQYSMKYIPIGDSGFHVKTMSELTCYYDNTEITSYWHLKGGDPSDHIEWTFPVQSEYVINKEDLLLRHTSLGPPATKIVVEWITKKNDYERVHKNKYKFFCAVEMNRACNNKSFTCTSIEECPEFIIGTDTEPASLKCKDNKWLIGNKYHHDLVPTCEEGFINTPEFFVKIDGKKEKLKSGECYKNYDCRVKSNLIYTECEDFEQCGTILIENNKLSCEDNERYMLSVFVFNSHIIYNETTEYMCDKENGVWHNGGGTVLTDRSQVICHRKPQEGYYTVMKGLFVNLIVISGISAIGILMGYIIQSLMAEIHSEQ